jgi:hypothetical protein
MVWGDGGNCSCCGSEDCEDKECVADHFGIPSLCNAVETTIVAPDGTQPERAVHLAFILAAICATIGGNEPYWWL